MNKNKKIVILSSVWLEPDSSAAGRRMLQLIHFFQSKNYQITYASTAQQSVFAEDLSAKNIKSVTIEINNTNFDDFIKEENPVIVLFDRFMIEEQFGWRVAEIVPNAIRILDTEDLHCLRKTRQEAYKKNQKFSLKMLLESDIAKREIASIYRCDLSLIISKYEMEILKTVFKVPDEIIMYLPFLLQQYNVRDLQNLPKFKERKHFYFIGNNLHQPNVATILELKKLWKSIADRVSDAELHIYGAYPKQQILQLHNTKERFIIKGRLEDKKVLKNYRVLLAPIPFGAGIKGKFFEAIQLGITSVTGIIGAEGIVENEEWCGFITKDNSDFIDKSILLYQDQKIWETAQKFGVKIWNTLFNEMDYLPILQENIEQISVNLKNHRNQNFIGQILMHHTLKSTKYLSKWIEAKNK